MKEALQVKLGEEPYKFVKPRPRMSDIRNNIKITEATLPVYGRWQVEDYVPPVAENVSHLNEDDQWPLIV